MLLIKNSPPRCPHPLPRKQSGAGRRQPSVLGNNVWAASEPIWSGARDAGRRWDSARRGTQTECEGGPSRLQRLGLTGQGHSQAHGCPVSSKIEGRTPVSLLRLCRTLGATVKG